MAKTVFNKGKRTITTKEGNLKPGSLLNLSDDEAQRIMKMYSKEVIEQQLPEQLTPKQEELKKQLKEEKEAHQKTKDELEELKKQLEEKEKELLEALENATKQD